MTKPIIFDVSFIDKTTVSVIKTGPRSFLFSGPSCHVDIYENDI